MRLRFANDPANLLAVQGQANQDKSDDEPAVWMPPNHAFWCQYAMQFIAVLRGYALPVDAPSAQPLRDAAAHLPRGDEVNSLRDLESAFNGVQKSLESGKLFLFDMATVQGLTEAGLAGNKLLYNDPQNLTVFTVNDYDYERQMQTIQYLIFQQKGQLWERSEAKRILRAFPTQAVASLLQRSGFNMRAILNGDLEPFEPNTSRATRVVFVAEKQ